MLRKFLLRDARDREVGAKHHGARGRGALIDGQYEGHERFPALSFCARQADWAADVKLAVAPTKRADVVPAKAGTHNHRPPLLRSLGLQPSRQHKPVVMGPGSHSASPHLSGTRNSRTTPPRWSHRRRPRWSARS